MTLTLDHCHNPASAESNSGQSTSVVRFTTGPGLRLISVGETRNSELYRYELFHKDALARAPKIAAVSSALKDLIEMARDNRSGVTGEF
jgi:hypothetical protein